MANETYDYSDVETKLKERAAAKGLAYDPSDLEDVKRHTGYDTGGISVDQALNNAFAKYDERAKNTPGEPAQSGGSDSAVAAWNAQPAQPSAAQVQNDARRDNLYNILLGRATKTIDVNPSNPVIAAQTNAYRAEQDRSARNFLGDQAEKLGPLANLAGEARMASQNVGRAVGGFQADLLSRELTAERDALARDISELKDFLSADQMAALQDKWQTLDNMIKQQSLQLQSRSLDQQQQNSMLQNQQFLANLGLQAEDRNSYWDAIRRGLLN